VTADKRFSHVVKKVIHQFNMRVRSSSYSMA